MSPLLPKLSKTLKLSPHQFLHTLQTLNLHLFHKGPSPYRHRVPSASHEAQNVSATVTCSRSRVSPWESKVVYRAQRVHFGAFVRASWKISAVLCNRAKRRVAYGRLWYSCHRDATQPPVNSRPACRRTRERERGLPFFFQIRLSNASNIKSPTYPRRPTCQAVVHR